MFRRSAARLLPFGVSSASRGGSLERAGLVNDLSHFLRGWHVLAGNYTGLTFSAHGPFFPRPSV
jgi:hypothetical protein